MIAWNTKESSEKIMFFLKGNIRFTSQTGVDKRAPNHIWARLLSKQPLGWRWGASGRKKKSPWLGASDLLFELQSVLRGWTTGRPSPSATLMTEHYLPFTCATLNANCETGSSAAPRKSNPPNIFSWRRLCCCLHRVDRSFLFGWILKMADGIFPRDRGGDSGGGSVYQCWLG